MVQAKQIQLEEAASILNCLRYLCEEARIAGIADTHEGLRVITDDLEARLKDLNSSNLAAVSAFFAGMVRLEPTRRAELAQALEINEIMAEVSRHTCQPATEQISSCG